MGLAFPAGAGLQVKRQTSNLDGLPRYGNVGLNVEFCIAVMEGVKDVQARPVYTTTILSIPNYTVSNRHPKIPRSCPHTMQLGSHLHSALLPNDLGGCDERLVLPCAFESGGV
jgi:hypothetical protein